MIGKWFIMMMITSLCLMAQPVVRNDHFGLLFDNGKLWLINAHGGKEVSMGRMLFSWSPPIAVPERAEKTADGAIEMVCRMEKDPTDKISVSSRAELTPMGFDVTYVIRVPKDFKGSVGGIMQEWRGVDKERQVGKIGLWTRSEKGGVPFETRDCYLRQIEGLAGELDVWYVISGNHNWGNKGAEHLAIKQTAENDSFKEYEGKMSFVVVEKGLSADVVAARRGKRHVVVSLKTDKPFNIYPQGNPSVELQLMNCHSEHAVQTEVMVWARNFDGELLVDDKFNMALDANGVFKKHYECPLEDYGMAFVEAKAVVDGQEVFTRTTLAKLPPFEYKYLDRSNIGIAAFFNKPSREDAFQLMRRMGVRYLRNGDNHESQKYGMIAMMHNNVSSQVAYREKDANTLDGMLEKYRKQDNVGWEFCNEWNMGKSREKKVELVRNYLSWVREIDKRRRNGLKINLISQGLAGADPDFQEEIARQGGWNLFDGVALHPGRGNVTPDALGDGWMYLGAIRRTKEVLEKHGVKPLYLTEAYACTQANNWWVDSLRQSAENTILTFAIGKAEGMAAVLFYQLHDAVWHDVGGINHQDREYDYGLLHRDCSPKPSLMAFATIAEELDGADFLRYFARRDTNLKGIEFTSLNGKFAVLYDRTDGIKLSEKSDDFIHHEPWITTWKTKTKHVFQADGDVVVRDCIGRRRTIRAENGCVTLELDGAPLIVHGVSLE